MNEAKVKYDELTAYTIKILEKLGYPKAQADVTAWALVEADARGVNSHGVGRLDFYESNIKNGFNIPAAEPEVVHETPLSVVIDGRHGVGAYIAKYAMNRVLEKAKNAGAGFAAVRNSNHFGMAALWGEMATAQGYIGMSFCNTRICSIVLFGKDRILGTNPLCFAIPSSGKVPFVLDMATTTAAHGKVEVYERLNKAMPVGWCVDDNGVDSTDVHSFQKIYREKKAGGHLFLGGGTEELGGHKGYGLGLFVDLLDDPLVVRMYLPESELKDVSVGQQVSIEPDNAPGTRLSGRVVRIAPEVDERTGTVNVTAETDGGAMPGSFARVRVVTDTRQETLAVPRRAQHQVRRRIQERPRRGLAGRAGRAHPRSGR